MLLPLSDSPNYSTRKPWVNYGLVALNVLVFLGAHATARGAGDYQRLIWEWGFIPAAPRLETYFTSMFLHGDFMHLGGNMLFLWIFGDNVEGRLGHLGYLAAYLAAGLAAVLLFQVLSPGTFTPLVGASGAIFGVTGFYFLAFPNNRVRVLIFMFLILFYEVRARWVLGFFFVVDFLNMVVWHRQGADTGGVAYAAHVGGFAFGLALALVLGRMMPPARAVQRRAVREPPVDPEALIQAGLAHARGRRISQAYDTFERVIEVAPATEAAGFAALQMGIIRGRVLGDFPGARGLLEYALRHLKQAAHIQRATAEMGEIS